MNEFVITDTVKLTAANMGIVPNIHKEDFIFDFLKRKKREIDEAALQYYRNGEYSAKLISDVIVPDIQNFYKRLGTNWAPSSVLDFASGYGCVARHLIKVLPNSTITTCDIHKEAVAFCKNVLDINSIQSATDPDKIILPKYDLIVVLSLFSHLPKHRFKSFLRVLMSSLKPRGAILFTTRGFTSNHISGSNMTADSDGFGFVPESEQDDLDKAEYGLTLSTPSYVIDEIHNISDVQLINMYGGMWWNHQDTWLCTFLPDL
jgi:SAM-dependent methyltransferase